METIFECYGEGGESLVLAKTANQARQAVREWLGWQDTVAFRAEEMCQVWQAAGGTTSAPVVKKNGRGYTVVTRGGGA